MFCDYPRRCFLFTLVYLRPGLPVFGCHLLVFLCLYSYPLCSLVSCVHMPLCVIIGLVQKKYPYLELPLLLVTPAFHHSWVIPTLQLGLSQFLQLDYSIKKSPWFHFALTTKIIVSDSPSYKITHIYIYTSQNNINNKIQYSKTWLFLKENWTFLNLNSTPLLCRSIYLSIYLHINI